jgi:periplasmic divalent cation tolerance protein
MSSNAILRYSAPPLKPMRLSRAGEIAVKSCFVYMTTESPEQARRIGRALVEARLAACVNILDGMTSLYWWQGKIDEGRETVLIAKTREDLVAPLTERVKSMHSYSCPCVVSIPIEGGSQAFLDWIAAETAGASEAP